MSTILETLSSLVFRARRGRVGLFLPIAAMAASVVMIMQAKPEDFIDTTVYTYTASSSPIPLLQKYVRVRGTLMPEKTIEGEAGVGKVTVAAGRYVPIFLEGAVDPVFVAADSLAELPAQSGPVEIVGLLQTKASFPTLYLTVETPPNIPLLNNVARAGILLGLAVLSWWVLGWFLARSDFALAALGNSERQGLGLMWFGGLGSAEGNALVRQAPVHLVTNQHEVRLQAADSREGWSVYVRELLNAQPARIATPYGALPALRLHFIDERGQKRRGTVVAGDTHERDALSRVLSARTPNTTSTMRERGAATH